MSTPLPPEVLQWAEREFPRPRVDPEWLEECYEWIVSSQNLEPTSREGLDAILQGIHEQLLSSDLVDSMVHGTGLPTEISRPETSMTLTGRPVLVQIVSITDVGVSAHSLNQTRLVREERIKAGAAPGGNEDNADEEVYGEGPVPKYQRSMLKFELSDGATTMKAIEYRPLPDLTLGVTPIGYKMLLRDVMIRRGIAFLEPRCVVLKGPPTTVDAESEARHAMEFERGLRFRMGIPDSPEATLVAQAPTPLVQAPPPQAIEPIATHGSRSPLRSIPRPPSPPSLNTSSSLYVDDDQPRRRRVPNTSTFATASSSTTLAATSRDDASNPAPMAVDLTLGPPIPSQDPLFIPDSDEEVRPDFYTAFGKVQINIPSTSESSSSSNSQGKLATKGHLVIDVDAFMVNQLPSSSSRLLPTILPVDQGRREEEQNAWDNPEDTASSDYGSEIEMGSAVLEQWDKAEQDASQSPSGSHVPNTAQRDNPGAASTTSNTNCAAGTAAQAQMESSSSGAGIGPGAAPSSSNTRVLRPDWSTMTISDDENDKENTPPPSRNVRRRTGNTTAIVIDGPSGRSQQSQRTGRPIILAQNPSDIIDITGSDSD